MTPSWRKPAGIFVILGLIALWSVLIGSMANILAGWPWPVQLVFYVVTGIVWITPLKPLLLWMETGRWRL